jgi:hypothetical protein
MKSFKQYSQEMQKLDEVFDKPYPWKKVYGRNGEFYVYGFQTDDGREVDVDFTSGLHNPFKWDVTFEVDGRMGNTDEGDQFRIFATVADIVTKFLDSPPDGVEVDEFFFTGSKRKKAHDGYGYREVETKSRVRLYKRFAEMLKKRFKFKTLKIKNQHSIQKFTLAR